MTRTFFLFYKDIKDIDFKLYRANNLFFNKQFRIKLSMMEYERLFGDSIDVSWFDEHQDFYVHVVESSGNLISYVDKKSYYDDADSNMINFLKRNVCKGVASVHVNKIIESLLYSYDIETDERIERLMGSNGWKSLYEFFNVLYMSNASYVVLRKFESMPYSIMEDDKDIDVLVLNIDEFVRISNASKRSIGISGYRIKICDEWVALDIRFIGDNYYDSTWERCMLDTRVCINECLYVLNCENLFFSILYHVLVQKKEISEYYKKVIEKMVIDLFGVAIEERDMYWMLVSQLKAFLLYNNYKCVIPLDYSVKVNKKIIKSLFVKTYPTKKKLFLIRILIIMRVYPQKLYHYVDAIM